ncbi:MAG: hypothetical protein ACXV2C_07405 [Candidatus Bathyarchaeia archaeon]
MGRDVSVDELRARYPVLIFATGSMGNRKMNVPGVELGGIHYARDFVGWYNCLPGAPSNYDLSGVTAVVIGIFILTRDKHTGNGNVAIDIARILSRKISDLDQTDISSSALSILKQSNIKNVSGFPFLFCT